MRKVKKPQGERPVIAIDEIVNRYDGVGIYCNDAAYSEGRIRVVIETEYQKKHDRIDGLLQLVIEKAPNKDGKFEILGVSDAVEIPWSNHDLGVSLNGKQIKKGWILIKPEIGDTASMQISERALPFEHSEVL